MKNTIGVLGILVILKVDLQAGAFLPLQVLPDRCRSSVSRWSQVGSLVAGAFDEGPSGDYRPRALKEGAARLATEV